MKTLLYTAGMIAFSFIASCRNTSDKNSNNRLNNSTEDYKSVRIADKDWMTTNLSTSVYRNGDTIPQVEDKLKWSTLTTGAWCY